MTRGAWMRLQQDDSLKFWLFAPRENEKPFAESERAQRWRLSLASLLFITVLLSDHLWFCAEAKLTRTRDKRSEYGGLVVGTTTDMQGEYSNNSLHLHLLHHHQHIPSPPPPRPPPDPRQRLANREQDIIFLGNSTKHQLWRMDTCHPDSLSKDCFTFTDAETACSALSGGSSGDDSGTTASAAYVNLSDLYLSFCNSYSLLDLFYGFRISGLGGGAALNCTPDMASGLDRQGCLRCVRAYQTLDLRAEEDYREFELMVHKYEVDQYSVRTCMEECKMVYKPWLCSQYFQTTQMHCIQRIPCHRFCLEVQQRCPFILPDNDDLIHGGSPSFICTGLLEDYPSGVDKDAECCDVRWDLRRGAVAPTPAPTDRDNRSRGTNRKRTHPPCQHRTSLSSSAPACCHRLCNSRLKLSCLLVLVLLHTACIATTSLTASQPHATSHNATGLGLPGTIAPLEESPAAAANNEE